jgi:hypothetical protein
MESKERWGKSAQGMSVPKQYLYRILYHGKFGLGYSIYDMECGAHTLDTFSQFLLLLDF